ncbi:ATP-grasp domain-containing protein [Bacillus sp. MUM 13]|uniref:ATP-grasp domain-containing protein n=1 Tax=Bacillus sp. MUM 13 TaxID=1678001 RepID=UPI0008F56450|nr:ATP-grasp domain-containing protein [Bacillus sp. MUM 13]OIK06806.1 hypothetical protein BIV59_21285 [Bacillus sp. MUM 13]
MKQKIIVVESGQFGEEIISIQEQGYDVIYLYTGIIPIEPKNLDVAFKIIKDKKLTSYEILADYIESLNKQYQIKTILTTSDFFIEKVSLLCRHYDFPFLNPETAGILINKHLFRKKQKELGYKHPDFFLFSSLEEGMNFIKEDDREWVFKPLISNESVGVRIIKNVEELKNAYQVLNKLSRFSAGLIKKEGFMLEEFISGEILSCEFIKDNNQLRILGFTSREMGDPPFFIELGYEFPFHGEELNSIQNQVKKFVHDFDYNFGPCHIEFIVNKHGLYILEVNPRLMGYPNYWMINKALDTDILKYITKLYITGSLFDFSSSSNKYTVCEEIVSDREGYISEIDIPEEWKANPDVWIINNISKGMYVRKAESNKDILMRILVAADTKKQSKELIKTIKQSINFLIS